MTLEQARGLVKLNQTQLARAAGVTKFVISDIETGATRPENVAHGTIVKIVRALQRAGLPGLTSEDIFPVEVGA